MYLVLVQGSCYDVLCTTYEYYVHMYIVGLLCTMCTCTIGMYTFIVHRTMYKYDVQGTTGMYSYKYMLYTTIDYYALL